jgi:hypothetical protein
MTTVFHRSFRSSLSARFVSPTSCGLIRGAGVNGEPVLNPNLERWWRRMTNDARMRQAKDNLLWMKAVV